MKMRYVQFVFLLFFLFIIPTLLAKAESCNTNLTVLTYLDSFSADNFSQKSLHKFPDFKEDDTLFIDNLIIKNNAQCRSTNYTLKFSVVRPNNITFFDGFCSYNTIKVPRLEANQTYILKFTKITSEFTENGMIYQRFQYNDSQNKNFTLCRIKLIKAGEWSITTELITLGNSQSGLINTYFIDKDNMGRDGTLKVHPKIEIEIIDLTSETVKLTDSIINLTWMILVLSVVTLVYSVYKTKKILKENLFLHQKFDTIKELLENSNQIKELILQNTNTKNMTLYFDDKFRTINKNISKLVSNKKQRIVKKSKKE